MSDALKTVVENFYKLPWWNFTVGAWKDLESSLSMFRRRPSSNHLLQKKLFYISGGWSKKLKLKTLRLVFQVVINGICAIPAFRLPGHSPACKCDEIYILLFLTAMQIVLFHDYFLENILYSTCDTVFFTLLLKEVLSYTVGEHLTALKENSQNMSLMRTGNVGQKLLKNLSSKFVRCMITAVQKQVFYCSL